MMFLLLRFFILKKKMTSKWLIVIYSCNKVLPFIWDILDSNAALDEFVLDSKINKIVGEYDCNNNDSNEYEGCCFDYDRNCIFYEIPLASYDYFTGKTGGVVDEHFQISHTNCLPHIIAIQKTEQDKLWELMNNLVIH